MNLILFIHHDSKKKGETFKKVIEQRFSKMDIQIIQTFNAFKERLIQPSNYNTDIFVLFVESKMRLLKLTSLIDLMEDKRLILVLPDDSKSTVSIAHQFFPRYFTFANDIYVDLCEVLFKLTQPKNEYN